MKLRLGLGIRSFFKKGRDSVRICKDERNIGTKRFQSALKFGKPNLGHAILESVPVRIISMIQDAEYLQKLYSPVSVKAWDGIKSLWATGPKRQ